MCYSRVMSRHWSACCWVRLTQLPACGIMQEPCLPTGWLWRRPTVFQEWSASNRSDPSNPESWWPMHEVSQWRHTSFIAPCGNVEIWRLRTENWPDRCKTCSRHPRVGRLDVVAQPCKVFQWNLHSKQWLLLLRTAISVPLWGALCTAKAQSCLRLRRIVEISQFEQLLQWLANTSRL